MSNEIEYKKLIQRIVNENNLMCKDEDKFSLVETKNEVILDLGVLIIKECTHLIHARNPMIKDEMTLIDDITYKRIFFSITNGLVQTIKRLENERV